MITVKLILPRAHKAEEIHLYFGGVFQEQQLSTYLLRGIRSVCQKLFPAQAEPGYGYLSDNRINAPSLVAG